MQLIVEVCAQDIVLGNKHENKYKQRLCLIIYFLWTDISQTEYRPE